MSFTKVQEEIQILRISKKFEEEARELILNGLEERFGFIDSSYNPDLNDIVFNYNLKGNVFLIGTWNNHVICTGAIFYEEPGVGRIVRMSVMKKYRRSGLAKLIIFRLELWAKQEGYRQVVLETNNDWQSAIEFYENRGYELYLDDGECSHFFKCLS